MPKLLNIFKPRVVPNFEQIELENVCRICLHSAPNMLSLFYNEIYSLLSEFLPQKLNPKPLQPHQICVTCFEQAKTAYIFKKQCEYSDELIRSVLEEPNIVKTCEKQTQTDISNFIFPCEECGKQFNSSETLKEHRLKEHHNTSSTFQASDNNQCQLCGKKFAGKSRLKTHLFDAHNISEYLLKKDAINKANEEDDSVFVRVFEVNSSNWLQIINDCDKKIDVVSVSTENESCLLFENFKTEDEHEENTVETNKEIFGSEFEIESEKLLIEELEVSKKIVGGMITEPKAKITREVKSNTNPKRDFPGITHAKPYLCTECGASFAHSNPLKVHMMRHRGQKPFKCRYCDKVFATTGEQYKHERTHTKERNYHCTVCSKTFTRHDNLQIHMRIHTGERPYKCSYCPKTFGVKTSLNQHYRRHTGERRERRERRERGERCVCDLCNLSYSTSQILLNHKRKVHGIDATKEFSCKHCSEKIIGAIEYKKHREAYHATPAQPHICSECGTTFKKSEYLKMHIIRRHSEEKPYYKCQYCDKAYASVQSLYRHKKTHTGKKHHCTNCPKVFLTSYQLRIHMRTHERPYKCSYCPMAFSENRSLKKHRGKHAGE